MSYIRGHQRSDIRGKVGLGQMGDFNFVTRKISLPLKVQLHIVVGAELELRRKAGGKYL